MPTRTRLVLAALLTAVLTAGVAESRGAALGLAALAFYGVVFGWVALRPEGESRWARAHPFLDVALVAPLIFFAAAASTNLSLLVCAAIAGGALLLQLLLMRRRRALAAPS